MEARLQKLWELQSIDVKIEEDKRTIEKNHKSIDIIKSELSKVQEDSKKKKEELNKKRLKIKDYENDIMSYDEKIKKLVGQLYTVKTNQEYSLLDTEIKNLKADKSLKEDELLNFVMELDKLTEELKSEENIIRNKEKELIEKEKQIKSENDKILLEIDGYEKLRVNLRTQIDTNLLLNYDRIIVKKSDKKVLAYIKPLEGGIKSKSSENSNVWACSECNVIITIQELNMILLNKEIVLCRSCSRILDIQLPNINNKSNNISQSAT